ncbi:hypothetical protein [Wenzhouxiangella marina]|uniref:Uncharacterized protein n=1 Tax=Wenzhouxiangella marina TaxID=1579979 RepID=A0A0K0XU38_9GAMM|nr:hypothetical protein [Wenzhouxiangella marina]AKS41185.1 hypothetical protein WM2015_804 [Wenzhouxiangella marina]MBB6088064.1 hypothetical protein [Wenzhouxiangella marina]
MKSLLLLPLICLMVPTWAQGASESLQGDPVPAIEVGVRTPATFDTWKQGAGGDGEMRFQVRLTNGVTAVAPTIVRTTLPEGLTFVNHSGSAWSCSAVGQALTCQYNNNLTSSSPTNNVRVRVNVAGDIPVPGDSLMRLTVEHALVPLPDPLVCESNASAGGYYVSDTGCVERLVPHRESQVFFDPASWTRSPNTFIAGSTDNSIEAAFFNQGFTPANGAITVRYRLPPGFLFDRAGPTTFWGCIPSPPGPEGQVVTCSRSGFSDNATPSTTGFFMRVDLALDTPVPGPLTLIGIVENAYQPGPADFEDCLVAEPPIGCSTYQIPTGSPPQARMEFVEISPDPDAFTPGQTGRVFIRYSNQGQATAGPLNLDIAAPPGFEFIQTIGANPAIGCTASGDPAMGQTINCSGASGVGVGQTGQLSLDFQVEWAGSLLVPVLGSIGDSTRPAPGLVACEVDPEQSGCGLGQVPILDALFCDRFESPSGGCRPL